MSGEGRDDDDNEPCGTAQRPRKGQLSRCRNPGFVRHHIAVLYKNDGIRMYKSTSFIGVKQSVRSYAFVAYVYGNLRRAPATHAKLEAKPVLRGLAFLRPILSRYFDAAAAAAAPGFCSRPLCCLRQNRLLYVLS